MRPKFFHILILAIFLASIFIPTRAVYAATITVESFGDGNADPSHCPGASCTLRDAIAKASAGDKITFNMAGFPTATITLTKGELTIDKNLTIQGPGSDILTIDANQASRIFRVGVYITSINVSISGMTLINGKSALGGAGIQVSNTGAIPNNISLNDMIITQNTGTDLYGGGIYNGGNLTITNSQITDNYSYSMGGGIYSLSGTSLNLTNVVISGNQTTDTNASGGGIYLDSTQTSPSNLTLDNVDILNNVSQDNGGGMTIGNNATALITNSVFDGNISDNSGGGIYIANSTDVTMTDSTVNGNQSLNAGGGGIYLYGNLTISDSTISANSADMGAGILVSINAIFNGSSLTINDNTAISYAGGVSNNGTTNLVNSTITTNSSVNGVGGIDSNYGIVELSNVTISGNASTNFIGGVRNTAGSTMTLKNSILANSTGGGVYATEPDCDDSVAITSEDYNLFEATASGCPIVGATAHNLTGIDPMLGTLANNGGKTYTLLPQAGSPVIDAANNATCAIKDQRGTTRPQDGDNSGFATCDIGAVEVDGDLVVQSVTRLDSDPTSASTVSFRVKFTEPVTGVDLTAPFIDFELSSSGLVGASILSVTGSGSEYTVQVNTGSGSGSIGVDVSDNDSITSISSGLPLGGVGTGNGDYLDGERYTIDRTPPQLIAISRSSSNPTNAASVDYTVTFSEAVTGVNVSGPLNDFALITSGVSSAAISGISTTDNTSYTITVDTGSGNGSIRLDLNDNDSITDWAGLPLNDAGTGDTYYGDLYTVSKTNSLIVTKLADTNDGACDSDCSLREAVASALDGYTIGFAPGLSGTITLTSGEIGIGNNITMAGPGASTLTISGNDASRVFFIMVGKTASISNLTINHGLVVDDMGGCILNNGNLTLDHVIVSDCQAHYDLALGSGGGIVSNAGTLTITNSRIADNLASKLGGGIFIAAGANLSITDSVFDHNIASDAGGGLYLETQGGVTSTITLNRVSVINNTASGSGGGGIFLSTSADITNSLIANNSTSGFTGGGGGLKIYEDGSGDPITVSVTNVTISGNTTVGQGGGVDVSLQHAADAVTFNNVTIADNHRNVMPGPPAIYGGGGIFASGPEPLDLQNSILAGNTSQNGTGTLIGGPDCEGTINSLDYNLIQDTTSCIISGTTTHNKTGVSANLGALANNGGSTLTMSLLAGSPALNAADNFTCSAKDQRGITRPQGAQCDMGAYEAIVTLTAKLMSTGTQDGWILESGENTNKGGTLNSNATTFNIGDDNVRKQYRGILSFASGAALPDNAVITKITLRLKKSTITGGGNPIALFGGFLVDIKKGIFGTAVLQPTDFQTTANKTFGPFQPALVGGWYSINLTTSKAYINKLATAGGLTQIRLRFKLDDNNNAVANFLSLYSGNAGAASRPQLIVEYYVP